MTDPGDDPPTIESDRDLSVRELRELYHIERGLEDLRSGLAEAATDEDLEAFFMAHSERTTEQLGPLEAIEAEPAPVENSALEGLRTDRDEIVDPLPQTKTEAGNGLERVRELPV